MFHPEMGTRKLPAWTGGVAPRRSAKRTDIGDGAVDFNQDISLSNNLNNYLNNPPPRILWLKTNIFNHYAANLKVSTKGVPLFTTEKILASSLQRTLLITSIFDFPSATTPSIINKPYSFMICSKIENIFDYNFYLLKIYSNPSCLIISTPQMIPFGFCEGPQP